MQRKIKTVLVFSSAFYRLSHKPSQQSEEVSAVMPILQMRKLRLDEVKFMVTQRETDMPGHELKHVKHTCPCAPRPTSDCVA